MKQKELIQIDDRVSLFTREWIEIKSLLLFPRCLHVSLFTREWIEIGQPAKGERGEKSPSLRGSGLK